MASNDFAGFRSRTRPTGLRLRSSRPAFNASAYSATHRNCHKTVAGLPTVASVASK
jgi:hypothetical protein